MHQHFSLELASEKIYDSRTRDYFREVVSSYVNSNYRSAVVMLWSVVICDLIYKLEEMRDIHSDQTAEEILTETSKRQEQKPQNPEWEDFLFDSICKRTRLLEPTDRSSIEHLRRQRHLSAHPILKTGRLFSPSPEDVRAHIRNALEGILLKPPIMSANIFDALTQDLSAKKDLFVPHSDEDLFKYLNAKYSRGLTPVVEDAIFRGLWKLVFRLTNEECNNNRSINSRALQYFYDRRKEHCRHLIKNDRRFYSEISHERSICELLRLFLVKNEELAELLEENAKSILRQSASELDFFAPCWFLSESPIEHLTELLRRVNARLHEGISTWIYSNVHKRACEHNLQSQANNIGIALYTRARNFNEADITFQYVGPFLETYEQEQFERLLVAIEANRQTYGRGGAIEDHKLIKETCDSKFGQQFDYGSYPNFIRHLGENNGSKSGLAN